MLRIGGGDGAIFEITWTESGWFLTDRSTIEIRAEVFNILGN